MHVTKIELYGPPLIELPIIYATPADSYIIRDASGLGPGDIDVLMLDTVNAVSRYQGRKYHGREIVMNIQLNPAYENGETVAGLRETLYSLLMPNYTESLQIRLLDEDVPGWAVTTRGYVKRFEIVPFSKDPMVQLTITCPEPFFSKSGKVIVPVSTESYIEVTNTGTAPTGFYFRVYFTAPFEYFKIKVEPLAFTGSPLLDLFMRVEGPWDSGDWLEIQTEPGWRRIRGGMASSGSSGMIDLIGKLSADSTWLMLHSGENNFFVDPIEPLAALDWQEFSYIQKFWGV
jgi:hypothetical protein